MIRALRPDEVALTYAIYRDAVRIGATPFYTEVQRRAWVPSDGMEDWWPDRVLGGTTWVDAGATGLDGFLTYIDGHLDLFFVRPAARRGPTAPALYDRMLAHARAEGRRRLTTHASHLARRFLERRGWQVVAREETERGGVLLERFAMEVTL
ncbi:GNAT family N-acetyltransferase [Palleronia sp. KMU-117]|uniref:GNAT family N-acetyltransferase n=1 Tax=Palleronia sp. KMU-117 TaxID=3434108 RepID=UPI003D722582